MSVTDVRFNALRNAHYHKARLRALDGLNKFVNFIVIMLGAGVASDALHAADHHDRAVYLGLATTFVATIQLVFDPGGRARAHEFLQRRFYELLADVEECTDATEAKVHEWEGALIRLYAEQPPTMRALDSIAYNETGDALGMDRMDRGSRSGRTSFAISMRSTRPSSRPKASGRRAIRARAPAGVFCSIRPACSARDGVTG